MLRRGGRGAPRPEPVAADHLPAGVPGPARPKPGRDAQGRFLPGAATAAVSRQGGKARQEAAALQRLLGLWSCPDDHDWSRYAALARSWRDDYMRDLAQTVGGGVIGPGPASLASSSALQLAASRWLYDRGAAAGDKEELLAASRLANDARQNLLAAHEIAAKEAKARVGPDTGPAVGGGMPWLSPAEDG